MLPTLFALMNMYWLNMSQVFLKFTVKPMDSSIFSYAPSRSSFCMGSDQDALVIAWSE